MDRILMQYCAIQTGRKAPGTYPVTGREFRYVSNSNKVDFNILFDQLFGYVSSGIPKSGGAITQGCKITLPNGDIFEAVSYKGDIEGWRLQLEQGAKALNEMLAIIDIETDSIVLDNKQSFCLTDCKIEFY